MVVSLPVKGGHVGLLLLIELFLSETSLLVLACHKAHCLQWASCLQCCCLIGLMACPVRAQVHSGRLEFEMDAADTLECLLTELPIDGEGKQLSEVLPSIAKADVAVAQRLHGAGILLVM